MKVGDKHYRSIWVDDARDSVHIIDQTRLPFAFETAKLDSAEAVAEAIKAMRVRGAPLIGVAAAFGIALAVTRDSSDESISRASNLLRTTRPTAVNLAWAIGRMRDKLKDLERPFRAPAAWKEAQAIAEEDVALNEAIGKHGLALLAREWAAHERPINILTTATRAGSPLSTGYGHRAHLHGHDAGSHPRVGRRDAPAQPGPPRRELAGNGAAHAVADNAGGHLMQHKMVDLRWWATAPRAAATSATRSARISALAARDNGILYAAVPTPTIDWTIEDGIEEIPIEERPEDEVRVVRGLDADGRIAEVTIAPRTTRVANPAFDVTPHDLVTGIITEKGVARASERELLAFWPRNQENKAYLT